MRLALLLCCFLPIAATAGCHSDPAPWTASEDAMFGPVGMRIHPIFTQAKDWTGDGKLDGVEALLEFTDAFDDPTKAAGTVIFELYAYHHDMPDPRGIRLAGPWMESIRTMAEQKDHWRAIGSAYSFQLPTDKLAPDKKYVLTATFQRAGREGQSGGRYFDQMMLEVAKNAHGAEGPTQGSTPIAPGTPTPAGQRRPAGGATPQLPSNDVQGQPPAGPENGNSTPATPAPAVPTGGS